MTNRYLKHILWKDSIEEPALIDILNKTTMPQTCLMITGDSASDVEPIYRKEPHTVPNADPLPTVNTTLNTTGPHVALHVAVEDAPDWTVHP